MALRKSLDVSWLMMESSSDAVIASIIAKAISGYVLKAPMESMSGYDV